MVLKTSPADSNRLSLSEHLTVKAKENGRLYPRTSRLLGYLLSGKASECLIRSVGLTSLRSIGLERIYGHRWWSHYEEVLSDLLKGVDPNQRELASALEFLATWAAEMISLRRSLGNRRPSAEEIHTSRIYAQAEHFFYLTSNGFLRRIFVEDLIREVGSVPRTIVDIGTGPSVLLRAACKIADHPFTVAVDMSKEAVRRSRLLASGAFDKVIWCVGLGQRLPIRTESSDLVLACEVIEHLANPRIVLKEIQRVMCTNGHAIISVPIKYPSTTHLYIFDDVYEFVHLLENSNLWVQSLNRFPVTESASVAIAVCRKYQSTDSPNKAATQTSKACQRAV